MILELDQNYDKNENKIKFISEVMVLRTEAQKHVTLLPGESYTKNFPDIKFKLLLLQKGQK